MSTPLSKLPSLLFRLGVERDPPAARLRELMKTTSNTLSLRALFAAMTSLIAVVAPGTSNAEIAFIKVMTAARPTTLVSPLHPRRKLRLHPRRRMRLSPV